MTVHGAKGLEAPMVFLPDTLQVPHSRRRRLVWSAATGCRSGCAQRRSRAGGAAARAGSATASATRNIAGCSTSR